jgi:hypothetical protein
MNFLSKLTLTMATASVFSPIVANASPVVSTGSTAAAVSIKFHDCRCGTTSGNFSINPGANASGGGTGVKELSAAVATGETKANADSSSSRYGTTASAKGYSAPVHFKYTTYSDVNNSNRRSEYTYKNDYKAQAAIEFAAAQKNAEFLSASAEKQVELLKKGYYRDGKYIEYSRSEMLALEASRNNEASLTLKANGQASALSTGNSQKSKVTSHNHQETSYEYKGSSAGLHSIPSIPK